MQLSKFAALSILAAFAGSVQAQHIIDNYAFAASNYVPQGVTSEQHWSDGVAWHQDHEFSHVEADADFHPWDPPYNESRSMSEYSQPNFGDATVRSLSYAFTQYSGVGNPLGFFSSSNLHIKQHLSVEVGAWPGFVIHLKLLVPMHGFMAARGNNGKLGLASASLEVIGKDTDGNVVGTYSGEIRMEGTGFNEFTYTSSGGWTDDIHDRNDVLLPTPFEQTVVDGIELDAHDLIDLGPIPTNQITHFTIIYNLTTTSGVEGSSGQHAMVDFSGTGGITFAAVDAFGQPFSNFQVNSVPESRSIEGTVDLQDVSTAPFGKLVQYEIRDAANSVASSGTTDLNPSGNYYIAASSLPAGNYTLWVKSDTFLAKTASVNLNGHAAGVDFSLKNGDVDGDNEIGLSDFGLLSSSFGMFIGDPGFVDGADLDKDGEVGLADFGILSANFGELGE